MRFKIKINNETSFEDIRNYLEDLKKANTTSIPLNPIRKIINFLEIKEIPGKGSSIRFQSDYLLNHHPFYEGYFQVHKLHKGGNKEEIRKSDFARYLYPALILIVKLKIENRDSHVK